jgi:hypothetical protein
LTRITTLLAEHPDPADGHEARGVGEVGGPLIHEPAPQVVEGRLGDVDVEHEQGDRDREHAVAESLDAARLPSVHGRAFGPGRGYPLGMARTGTFRMMAPLQGPVRVRA